MRSAYTQAVDYTHQIPVDVCHVIELYADFSGQCKNAQFPDARKYSPTAT